MNSKNNSKLSVKTHNTIEKIKFVIALCTIFYVIYLIGNYFWPFPDAIYQATYYIVFYYYFLRVVLISLHTNLFITLVSIPVFVFAEYINQEFQPWTFFQNHPIIFAITAFFSFLPIGAKIFENITSKIQSNPNGLKGIISNNRNKIAFALAIAISSTLFLDKNDAATLSAWLLLIPAFNIIISSYGNIETTTMKKVYNKKTGTYEDKEFTRILEEEKTRNIIIGIIILYFIFGVFPYLIEHGDHLLETLKDIYSLEYKS